MVQIKETEELQNDDVMSQFTPKPKGAEEMEIEVNK